MLALQQYHFENILQNPNSVKKLLFRHNTNAGIHMQNRVQPMDSE